LRDSVFNWEDPRPKNPEHIRILATWAHDNIVEVPIPQLNKTAIGPEHPPPYGSIGWVLPNCKGCGRSGRRRGLLDRILSFGGGFEPCFVRGSTTTLSNHSFGSAFDINVAWNERGHRPALVGEKARCASSFPSPTNGASGGAGISVRRTACISRWPC